MNSVLSYLENIRSFSQMDANNFYPMVLPLLVVGVSKCLNFFERIKERKERKIFELHCKSESDNFFMYVILGEIVIIFPSLFGGCIFYEIIVSIFSWKRGQLGDEWIEIISAIISLGITMKLTRISWIRKRLLGDKKGKRIIIGSILLINIGFMCGMLRGEIKYVGSICMILYIVLEVMGLMHFKGRYTKYDFSSMKLYLNNGEVIICEDIEKISRRRDYISIDIEGRNIVLQYDKIWKVEYYGLPKILLK